MVKTIEESLMYGRKLLDEEGDWLEMEHTQRTTINLP